MRSIFKRLLSTVLCIVILSGCQTNKNPLNPKKPLTITIWHYYSGQNNEAFDRLINTFNDTVGIKEGVYVKAMSIGDVTRLEDAVYASANKDMGANPLPDIFGAYPDNAFRVNEISPIAELNDYFSEKELSEYQQDFLDAGILKRSEGIKIFPIARSTEVIYLNKTDWDRFSKSTGADLNSLKTWEGVLEISENYYNWTDSQTPQENDGKAFLGIDSVPNFMFVTAKQLGHDIVKENAQGKLEFDLPREVAYKMWQTYYVPHVKGWFAKSGRFSSDDAKTGDIIAYIGSTAGAGYFPNKITLNQNQSYEIDSLTFAYPYFKEGAPVTVQNGAGMCIAKSDKQREYASALFLKWFTQPQQNLKFAVATGYMPVKKEALQTDVLIKATKEFRPDNRSGTIMKSLVSSEQMIKDYVFHSTTVFNGSYDVREIMETSMFELARKDKESNIADVDANFDSWYLTTKQQIEQIIS